MPTILLTNDDGVDDPGLFTLKQALDQIGDVIVMAPERNRSAASHAITMHKPMRIRQVSLDDGTLAYACSGNPADCVKLAAGGVLDIQPDLVVSGINSGHNMGIDVYYSGTVACAREAVINGIPALAVSSVYRTSPPIAMEQIWETTTELTIQVAKGVLQRGLPAETLLNLNVPGLPLPDLKGLRITRLGRRSYMQDPVERTDPYGRTYYWTSGGPPIDQPDEMTDVGAVAQGYASLTPIALDATNRKMLDPLENWF
ncbi:5'/3'-nucleotidase SurE [Chloroflexi bacterium TSY]|nr:5'/3'-nucleotidase SurE [Chloroflexi bacterium TSY]